MSSANVYMSVSSVVRMSAVYVVYKRGAKTLPCGMPALML